MKEGRRLSPGYARIESFVLESWRPYLWLFALAFATYARTTGFGFSPLDDRWMIVDTLDELRHLSAVPAVFTHAVLDLYYRPVLALSFVIDALAGHGGPFAFHLTNVLLHGLVSATLFALFTKLDLTRRSALLLSALFAVHPVHVHAVAWIPGRNDMLLAVFALGATITFLDYLASRSAAALVLHACFFALALLTKESAAVLPLALLSYLLFSGAAKIKTVVLVSSWTAVLTLWALAWRLLVHGGSSIKDWDAWGVAIDAASGFIVYCGKLVVPVQQAVFPTVGDSSLIPGLLALAAGLALITWRGFVDKRKAAFGAIWFLLFLVPPLLHGSSNGIGEHYEHRLYLPSIGFLLLLSQIDGGQVLTARTKPRAFAVAYLLLLGVLFGKTVYRTGTYRDARTLAEAGVRESPHLFLAYAARGTVLSDAGEYDRAAADFERALASMGPRSANRAKVEARLAASLSKQGRASEAVDHYLEALRVSPGDADVLTNLGNELSRLGKLDEAIDHYSQALRIRPEFAKAHNNLGVALMRQRRIAEGAREFSKAVRIQPDYPGARQNLDRALKLLGDRPVPGPSD